MKKMYVLIGVIFLIGCGTTGESRLNLQNGGGNKIEFQVEKNYQDVYRIIKKRLQDNNSAWFGSNGQTDGDLYTDKQTAYVSYDMNYSGIGVDSCFFADIRAIDEHKTSVALYSRKAGLVADGWGDVSREVMELVKKPD